MSTVVVRKFEEQDLPDIKSLFTAYHTSLPIDISYQNYQDEYTQLPYKYDISKRGALFLAEKQHSSPPPSPPSGTTTLPNAKATVLGCVALRMIDGNTCELKRLYVRSDARGLGVGNSLVKAVIEEAQRLQYRRILLDTLPTMKSALALYYKFGFEQIPKYYETPIEETVFLEKKLQS
jgi:ribosomal protein S18 acetylase RimI-like enzyme